MKNLVPKLVGTIVLIVLSLTLPLGVMRIGALCFALMLWTL